MRSIGATFCFGSDEGVLTTKCLNKAARPVHHARAESVAGGPSWGPRGLPRAVRSIVTWHCVDITGLLQLAIATAIYLPVSPLPSPLPSLLPPSPPPPLRVVFCLAMFALPACRVLPLIFDWRCPSTPLPSLSKGVHRVRRADDHHGATRQLCVILRAGSRLFSHSHCAGQHH